MPKIRVTEKPRNSLFVRIGKRNKRYFRKNKIRRRYFVGIYQCPQDRRFDTFGATLKIFQPVPLFFFYLFLFFLPRENLSVFFYLLQFYFHSLFSILNQGVMSSPTQLCPFALLRCYSFTAAMMRTTRIDSRDFKADSIMCTQNRMMMYLYQN